MNGTLKIIILSAPVAALCLLFSLPASAETLERPARQQGYYLSAGPAGGMVLHGTSDGRRGPYAGPGFSFRLGEALTRRFDLGVGGGVFWMYGQNQRSLNGNFSLEFTFHPTKGLWLMAGAGLGFTDFTRRVKGIDAITGRFSGEYTVAAGWDLFFGQRDPYRSGGVALTPVAGVRLGPASPTSAWIFFVGVNVTWWTGLPKNKLLLPVDRAF
jgi:hypothetical protein